MPPVDAERIKFIERTAGPRDHWVYIVFKCKYDCKTLFTFDTIKEMFEFTGNVTAEPSWNKLCRRNPDEKPVDGWGCNGPSYRNLTFQIEPLLNVVDSMKQSVI
jgi:hypothetical protein